MHTITHSTSSIHPAGGEFTIAFKKNKVGPGNIVVDSPYKKSDAERAGIAEKQLFSHAIKHQIRALKSVLKSQGTTHISAPIAGRAAGSSVQVARTSSGHQLHFQSSKANVFVVPSAQQLSDGQTISKPGFVMRQAYKLVNALFPAKYANWDAGLDKEDKAGANTVPHQFATGQATTESGKIFKIHDGMLFKFNENDNKWERASGEPLKNSKADHYDSLIHLPNGTLWAVRNQTELVSIESNGSIGSCLPLNVPVASFVHESGDRLIALDKQGRVSFMTEEGFGEPVALPLHDDNGEPLPGVQAELLACAGDGDVFIQGSDGQMYKLAYPGDDKAAPPFGERVDADVSPLAKQHTLLKLAYVPADTGNSKAGGHVHALYAQSDGTMVTAYYDKSDKANPQFKGGWDLTDAMMYTNMFGLRRVVIPPQNLAVVDRDGLKVGFREKDKSGTLYAKRADGDWERTSVKGVSRIKVNPLGEERMYALQTIKTDKGERQAVVRLNPANLGQHVGTSLPQEGVDPPPKTDSLTQTGQVLHALDFEPEALLVDEKGGIRDFAVVEGFHGPDGAVDLDGHAHQHMCYVDGKGGLHVNDLIELRKTELQNSLNVMDGEPPKRLDPKDIPLPKEATSIKHITIDNKGDLYALSDDKEPVLFKLPYASLKAVIDGKEPGEATNNGKPLSEAARADNGWTKIDLKLDDGSRVEDINCSYNGRLHLAIVDPKLGKLKDGLIEDKKKLKELKKEKNAATLDETQAKEKQKNIDNKKVKIAEKRATLKNTPPVFMEYTEGIGLHAPRSRNAIDAIKAAAGYEFKVKGLPMFEVANEVASFRSTDNVIGSKGPGWTRTKLAYLRGMAAMGKVAWRAAKHSATGYPAFRTQDPSKPGLYDAVKNLANEMDNVVRKEGLPKIPARLADLKDGLNAWDPEKVEKPKKGEASKNKTVEQESKLLHDIQTLQDTLIRGVDQALDHINCKKKSKEFNHSFSDTYVEALPPGFSTRDLKGDPVRALYEWFSDYKEKEAASGGEFIAKHEKSDQSHTDLIVFQLERMLMGTAAKKAHAEGKSPEYDANAAYVNPHRVYLHIPDPNQPCERNLDDPVALMTAKILLNLQTLQKLDKVLAGTEKIGNEGDVEQLSKEVEDLQKEYEGNPVRRYSQYGLTDFKQLEATFDTLYGSARRMSNWKHPLCLTMAASHGIATPDQRRKELLDMVKTEARTTGAARQSQAAVMRRTEINQYSTIPGCETLAGMQRMLEKKNTALMDVLKAQQTTALRNATVDVNLGLKPKENYVVESGLSFGIDPFAYVRDYGFFFAFIGAMFQRTYTMFSEPLTGDVDMTTGWMVKAPEKEKRVFGELAAGVGYSFGHGPGLFDHFARAAAWGESGLFGFDSSGMMMIMPRLFEQEFTERLWEMAMGKPKDADLGGVLDTAIEREGFTHKGWGFEKGITVINRAGPNGYYENFGGAALAMRSALPHLKLVWGANFDKYDFVGTMLNGDVQPGIEVHRRNQTGLFVALAFMSFRNWFNVPSASDATNQFGVGFGNNDTWLRLGFENKDNIKCEYRANVPSLISKESWMDRLVEASIQFPSKATDLEALKDIADDPKTFAQELIKFKKEVSEWTDEKGNPLEGREEFCKAIDAMRMQHYQAQLGQNKMFGGIHELRVTNPNRLLQPGSFRTLGQWLGVLDKKKEADKPIHKLHGWVLQDKRLGRAINDIASSHSTRIKVKYEYLPDKMMRLTLAQLKGVPYSDVKDVPEDKLEEMIAEIDNDFKDENSIEKLKKEGRTADLKDIEKNFMFDPANCRIKTIEGLSGRVVDNGVLIAPVFAGGASSTVVHEADQGTILFNYKDDKSVVPDSFTSNAQQTYHRHSEEKVKSAFQSFKPKSSESEQILQEIRLRKAPVEIPASLSRRHKEILKTNAESEASRRLRERFKQDRMEDGSAYSLVKGENKEKNIQWLTEQKKINITKFAQEMQPQQNPPVLPPEDKKKLSGITVDPSWATVSTMQTGEIKYANTAKIVPDGGAKAGKIIASLPSIWKKDDGTSSTFIEQETPKLYVETAAGTSQTVNVKAKAAKDFNEQIAKEYAELTPQFDKALGKLGIQAVYNSGSDNNCFIQSLLQHASGRYDKDFAAEAQAIRAQLIGDGLLLGNEEMHSDTTAMKKVVELIHVKYPGAKIWPMIVQMSDSGPVVVSGPAPSGETLVPIVAHRHGLRHYEALVTVKDGVVKEAKKKFGSMSSTLSQLTNFNLSSKKVKETTQTTSSPQTPQPMTSTASDV